MKRPYTFWTMAQRVHPIVEDLRQEMVIELREAGACGDIHIKHLAGRGYLILIAGAMGPDDRRLGMSKHIDPESILMEAE